MKYAVKVTSVATDTNPNFAGKSEFVYYGKKEEIFSMTGSAAEATHTNTKFFYQHLLGEYGYKRLCDAKRSWSYNNPNSDDRFWNTKAEIVKVFEPGDVVNLNDKFIVRILNVIEDGGELFYEVKAEDFESPFNREVPAAYIKEI